MRLVLLLIYRNHKHVCVYIPRLLHRTPFHRIPPRLYVNLYHKGRRLLRCSHVFVEGIHGTDCLLRARHPLLLGPGTLTHLVGGDKGEALTGGGHLPNIQV